MARGFAVLLLYPGPRSVAYSSLAFHLIRGLLSSLGVGVKTAFLEDGVLEAGQPLDPRETRAVLVSLPYEIMYADMVRALEQLGLNPWAQGRGDGDPLVIAGGPAATANPAPLLDLVDAVLVGELEPVAEGLVDALQEPSRGARLEALSRLPGVLVPSLENWPVRRVYVEDLDAAWYPLDQRAPPGVEPVWGRGFILETSRGCGRGCRFCMEGTVFRPRRDRSLEVLKHLLREGVRVNRVGRAIFYSLVFFDNRASDEILRHAVEDLGLQASVPSLRAETLTEERARLIARGGQRTVTIAPETGSCTIARAILKPIGGDITLWAVENLLSQGIPGVKLYLITGFPGEGEEDLAQTQDLAIRVVERVRKAGGVAKVSINPFMPKPVTGMQWAGLAPRRLLEERINRLSRALRRAGARVSGYDPRWAEVQVALARGGREMARVVVEWARMPRQTPSSFRAAARRAGVSLDWSLGEWPADYTPPWHRLVEHPRAELWRLRRDWMIYRRVVESRGGASRLRIPGCTA
ncbi:B12-binding domain-containing radical SAM protein [Aeropyrum camini]|uniref:Fe-S oxidoreductase n=1 Tax=Aeropyrum camini SY1 = JCM 12091 TaxID=1198449 RepID=U3TFX0_9CREN|nr:radical SAM protein [Aeropyrum camini]BAN90204.1 Fe-S oxidoreductase [Aeropyrum camini SY1 = JCM 12091]